MKRNHIKDQEWVAEVAEAKAWVDSNFFKLDHFAPEKKWAQAHDAAGEIFVTARRIRDKGLARRVPADF